VLVTPAFDFVIPYAPMVPPLAVHDALLILAVVVDGDVLMFVSGGTIFTLPVMPLQVTLPVAFPRTGFPALAGPAKAATPPNASAAATAVIPILRSI
jgi:hypothetical protein